MRSVFIFAVMLAAAAAGANAQEGQTPGGREADVRTSEQKTIESANAAHLPEGPTAHKPDAKAAAAEKLPDVVDHIASEPPRSERSEPVRNMRPVDYVRPDRKKRLETYIRNVAGPVAITRYAATAGLLTLRNTPKEWGTKPDGYGKRFANVAAKSLIRNTTVYALDEMLKVDSTFYLSRDRSPAARLRNSLFSAVTARNRRGQRVIGIPQLAGSFLSEVTSSVVWYPSRYDQDHGLKGGAISIGINTGFNIFREFILKR